MSWPMLNIAHQFALLTFVRWDVYWFQISLKTSLIACCPFSARRRRHISEVYFQSYTYVSKPAYSSNIRSVLTTSWIGMQLAAQCWSLLPRVGVNYTWLSPLLSRLGQINVVSGDQRRRRHQTRASTRVVLIEAVRRWFGSCTKVYSSGILDRLFCWTQ